jgi:CheY-like chemotaxis protein
MQLECEADNGFCVTLRVPRDVPGPQSLNSMISDGCMRPEVNTEVNPEVKVDKAVVAPAASKTSSSIKVLLADDHELVRDGLATLLQELDIFTIVGMAADGRQAVQLAAELEPDVVLMDFSMPVMNGIEATTQIRRLLPGIRIIGLTMHNDPEIRKGMLSAGACACLSKAISPEELIKNIQMACLSKSAPQKIQMPP